MSVTCGSASVPPSVVSHVSSDATTANNNTPAEVTLKTYALTGSDTRYNRLVVQVSGSSQQTAGGGASSLSRLLVYADAVEASRDDNYLGGGNGTIYASHFTQAFLEAGTHYVKGAALTVTIRSFNELVGGGSSNTIYKNSVITGVNP